MNALKKLFAKKTTQPVCQQGAEEQRAAAGAFYSETSLQKRPEQVLIGDIKSNSSVASGSPRTGLSPTSSRRSVWGAPCAGGSVERKNQVHPDTDITIITALTGLETEQGPPTPPSPQPRPSQLPAKPSPPLRTSQLPPPPNPRSPTASRAPPPRRCFDESLPEVSNLAEAGWTRALTENITRVAHAQTLLGGASASGSSSPYASQLGRPSVSIVVPGSNTRPIRVTGTNARNSVTDTGQRNSSLDTTASGTTPIPSTIIKSSPCLPPIPGATTKHIMSSNTPSAHTMSFTASALNTANLHALRGSGCCYDTSAPFCTMPSETDWFPEDSDADDAEELVTAALIPQKLLDQAEGAGVDLQLDFERDIQLDSKEPPLGRGVSGSVHKGVFRGQQVAVKILPPDLLLGQGAELHTFVQEMVVLASVRHPCIVNMLGGSLRPPHVFIVEELCAQSLDARLHRPGAGPLTNREMLKYAVDVAQGLQYLHERSPPIVHRDLKPGNVLLDANGTAKISDFGLARVKTQAAINTRAPEVGSIGYMAPECFTAEDGLLTDKCDTWSLGVMLWEMVTRQRPWQGKTFPEYYKEVVLKKSRLVIPLDDNICPMALRQLISSCWYDNPEERPSCAHIVSTLSRILKYCPPGC